MSARDVEGVLAALYTNAEFRARFLADPAEACRAWNLSAQEVASLASIDRAGLELAVRGMEAKRAARPRGPVRSLFALLSGRR